MNKPRIPGRQGVGLLHFYAIFLLTANLSVLACATAPSPQPKQAEAQAPAGK